MSASGRPVALPLVGSRFSASKLALARHLLLLLTPALLFNGLFPLWGAVLNAHARFLLRALASLAIAIGPLVFVAAFGLTFGISALALGAIAGFALEVAILGAGVRGLGVPLWPRWHGMDPRLRQVLAQFAPMFMGSLVMGLNPIVYQSMAATLTPGSVAAIGYGGKAVAMILSLGGVAIRTAVLPHFSTMVAKNHWAGIRSTMRVYSRLVFGLSLAATALGVFFSPELVHLVFQHGKFTLQDALREPPERQCHLAHRMLPCAQHQQHHPGQPAHDGGVGDGQGLDLSASGGKRPIILEIAASSA